MRYSSGRGENIIQIDARSLSVIADTHNFISDIQLISSENDKIYSLTT